MGKSNEIKSSKPAGMDFAPGEHVIMGVAPGWIFAGTVSGVTSEVVMLTPAIWIENVNAPWPEAAKDRKKITKSSHIPYLRVRKSAILWDSDTTKAVVNTNAIAAVEDSE